MQRLIDDANKVKVANGEMADLSIDSFADVTEAIHIIQTEMGITGTTATEAATTIEGSISMMKGAWENLVVGMADENANMEVLIGNFVESTATAAQNLLPRIEQTLIGIGQLITALAPVIAEALPVLVEDVLPALLAAAVSLVVALVNGIITALPALYTALLEGVQTILVQVFGVSEEKAGEFANAVNSFFVKIKDGFIALVESAQTEGTWLNGIWTGLQNTAKLLGEFLSVVWDTLVKAWQWCVKQFKTEGSYLDTVWDNIKIVISSVVTYIQELLKVFIAVFKGDWKGAWEGVKNIFKNAWNTMRDLIKNVWDFIKSVVSKAVEAVRKSISEKFTAVKEKVSSIFNSIKTTISNVWDKIKSVVKTAIMFIVELVKAWFDLVTLPFRAIWENCKETIIAAWNKIKSTVSNALDAIKSTISKVWNAISSVLSPILNKIKSAVSTAWNSVKSAVSSVITSVKSTISTGLNSAKSTVSSVLEGIKSKFTSIFNGAKTIVQNAINFIKGLFKFEWSLPKIKLPHFSITGEFSLSPPSVPKLTISWYKKAYESAMVLGNPTIFGYSAASGKFLGGGDGSGNEIVAGESYLMGLIGSVVEGKTAEQNERIVSVLGSILEAITGGNREMLQAILEGQTIVLNNREFGRAVREYAR